VCDQVSRSWRQVDMVGSIRFRTRVARAISTARLGWIRIRGLLCDVCGVYTLVGFAMQDGRKYEAIISPCGCTKHLHLARCRYSCQGTLEKLGTACGDRHEDTRVPGAEGKTSYDRSDQIRSDQIVARHWMLILVYVSTYRGG
jgi:hypothetical protein